LFQSLVAGLIAANFGLTALEKQIKPEQGSWSLSFQPRCHLSLSVSLPALLEVRGKGS
jgi:hypothetical protein